MATTSSRRGRSHFGSRPVVQILLANLYELSSQHLRSTLAFSPETPHKMTGAGFVILVLLVVGPSPVLSVRYWGYTLHEWDERVASWNDQQWSDYAAAGSSFTSQDWLLYFQQQHMTTREWSRYWVGLMNPNAVDA